MPVTTSLRTSPGPERLDARASQRLGRHLDAALRRARSSGTATLASVTSPIDPAVDPTRDRLGLAPSRRAVVLPRAARPRRPRAGGARHRCGALEDKGPDRFERVAARWRELAEEALADDGAGPPGYGVGRGRRLRVRPRRRRLAALAGVRAGVAGRARGLGRAQGRPGALTLNLDVAPDDTVDDLRERARRRLGELRDAVAAAARSRSGRHLRCRQPDAARRTTRRRSRRGGADPGRRAREDRARPRRRGPRPDRPRSRCRARRAAGGVLRPATCSRSAAATRRSWAPARSCWCAERASGPAPWRSPGSIGRSADPAVDDHLGEQLLHSDKDREENVIVARRIARALKPHAVWVTASPEPVVVRVANIQHLARRSAPSWPRRRARSSWPACCTPRRRWAASRGTGRSN